MDEQRHGKAGELPLTAEEKAGLCIGADFWHVRGVPRLGLKGIMVADGPGLRKQVANHDSARPSDSVPAVCFPTASAVACTLTKSLPMRWAGPWGGVPPRRRVGAAGTGGESQTQSAGRA